MPTPSELRSVLAARFNFVLRMQAAAFCAAVKSQKAPDPADLTLADELDHVTATLTGTPLLHQDGTIITDPCDEVGTVAPKPVAPKPVARRPVAPAKKNAKAAKS